MALVSAIPYYPAEAREIMRQFTVHDRSKEEWQMMRQIHAKTLIIQGDRDPFYPIEISVEMYRHIPNASLWIIPNGGHVPLSNDELTVFKNFLLEYLL